MTKYEMLTKLLTEQISQNLQQGITSLPTEAQLCAQYQVSRQTVRAALSLLKSQGIITSRQGSGSYATGLLPFSDRNVIPVLVASGQEYIYPNLLNDMQNVLSSQGYQIQIYPTEMTSPQSGSIFRPSLRIRPGA